MQMARRPHRSRLTRAVSTLASTALLSGALVMGVSAPAQAAVPFGEGLYGTNVSTTDRNIYSVDRTTGASSTVATIPNTAAFPRSGNLNQIGLSNDGNTLILTDGGSIFEYTASSEQWERTVRAAPVVGNTMGGVDPTTGLFYFGGQLEAGSSTFRFKSYDPATNQLSATFDVTATTPPGGNGDLAFDRRGNMYFVAGAGVVTGATGPAQVYRVDAADLGRAGAEATAVGGVITGSFSINSMAFGTDGFIYIGGNTGGAGGIQRVNPITGAADGVQAVSGIGLTDLGSRALPATGQVIVEPGDRFEPDDEFSYAIGGNGVAPPGNSATTDGDAPAEIGPLLLVPSPDPYSVVQTPTPGTNPANYETTWQCVDTATGVVVSSGEGSTATFIVPASRPDIRCSFTNTPLAAPDAPDLVSNGNELGSPATLDVLDGATGDGLDPESVRIIDAPGDGRELVVDGEGTWTVDPETGVITFTPEDGFTGNPTPISYEVSDERGNPASGSATVNYTPDAVNDASASNPQGTTVRIDVLDNDRGVTDPTSVRIVDGDQRVTELVVEGEGTWTVDPATGVISFVPLDGFSGNPTPITYEVAGTGGDTAQAGVTVSFSPTAVDDASLNNDQGSAVGVDVLGNDLGDLDPTSVTIVDGDERVTTLVVPGEGTWTVDPVTGVITFTPEDGFSGNPTPITYEVTDVLGETSQADVTVTYAPVAVDDASLNNDQGSAVGVDVLGNDLGDLDPRSVTIVDGDERVTTLVVPGEGTWTVDPATGVITFEPLLGYSGNPTPITYEVTDVLGETSQADVTVTYVPVAVDDESRGNPLGLAVPVDVTANDLGDLDPTTVRIVDGDQLVTELVVAGQGTWSVDAETGVISFTPADGYEGNPTPITYQVADELGETARAEVVVTYLPQGMDDESLNNDQGTDVSIDVLANDRGDLDPASVRIIDGDERVTELVVAGQGTWTVDTETGAITFSPEDGFSGNPTPITYEVIHAGGTPASAEVTVTYAPQAADDESRGNALDTPVVVDVLGNDLGDLDPASVRIVDGDELVTELVVEGQGTWTVDAETGAITFTPADGYEGNPTPITYQVADALGETSQADVTVTYTPVATADESLGNELGTTVIVDVLANDRGDLDPASVRIVDGEERVTELVVAGQGTWTVNPENGQIRFTPAEGFTGNPTPITYEVTHAGDTTVGAPVKVTYLPQALDDESRGNQVGSPVSVDVLGNDRGQLDPTTVRIVDGDDLVTELVVDGQGVWTVDPETGVITFTPADGFTGDPDPITYQVSDVEGSVTEATVTIDYDQPAVDAGGDVAGPDDEAPGGLGFLPDAGGPAFWLLLLGAALTAVGAGVTLAARRRSAHR